MTLALRRHHVQRIKAKVKKYRVLDYKGVNDKDIGIIAKTHQLCSCYCCGNPRKWFKEKTIQEKRYG